jgi:hypothetical protein
MPQHMRVDIQVLQAGRLGYLADHVPDGDAGERLSAFADKERVDVSRRIHLRPLNQPRLHRLALAVVELVWSRVATFEPVHVKLFPGQLRKRKFTNAYDGVLPTKVRKTPRGSSPLTQSRSHEKREALDL